MYKGFNRHEILKVKYRKEISGWDWNGLKRNCDNSEPSNDDCLDTKTYSTYVGSILGVMPSGKYYMPWTTNQTKHDVEKDTAFWEVLEEVAESYGLYVFSGEGSATDLFVGYNK